MASKPTNEEIKPPRPQVINGETGEELNPGWTVDDYILEAVLVMVPLTRDSGQLVWYLRQGRKVTPELAFLIADILEGKIKAKSRAKKRPDVPSRLELKGPGELAFSGVSLAVPSRLELKEFVEAFRRLVTDGDHAWLKRELKSTRYKGKFPPETKGDITLASKHLTADAFKLSFAELDARINMRARSKKTI